MAAPNRKSGQNSNGSFNATGGTMSAASSTTSGNVGLVFVAVDNNCTIALSGYTQVAILNNGIHCTAAVFKRELTGTDDGTFTVSPSKRGSWIFVEYEGDPDLANIEATTGTGSGLNADCPSHTPSGGSDDYLYEAFAGIDRAVAATGAPSGYSGLLSENPGSGASATTNIAYKETTASSSDNPAAFTSGSEDYVVMTVSIPPAAGGTDVTATVTTPTVEATGVTATVSTEQSVTVEVDTAESELRVYEPTISSVANQTVTVTTPTVEATANAVTVDEGGGGSSTFDDTLGSTVTGALHLYDPKDGTNVLDSSDAAVDDGDNIQTLTDLGSVGYDFTQSTTGNQAVWDEDGINSLGAIQGAASKYYTSNVAMLKGQGAITIGMIVEHDASGTYQTVMRLATAAAGNRFYLYHPGDDKLWVALEQPDGTAGGIYPSTTLTDATVHILVLVFNFSSNSYTYYVDDSSAASGSLVASSALSNADGGEAPALLASDPYGGNTYRGKMGLFGVWGTAFTSTQASDLHDEIDAYYTAGGGATDVTVIVDTPTVEAVAQGEVVSVVQSTTVEVETPTHGVSVYSPSATGTSSGTDVTATVSTPTVEATGVPVTVSAAQSVTVEVTTPSKGVSVLTPSSTGVVNPDVTVVVSTPTVEARAKNVTIYAEGGTSDDDSGWIGYDGWRENVLKRERAEKQAREESQLPLADPSPVLDEDTGDDGSSVPKSKGRSTKIRTLRTSRRKSPLKSDVALPKGRSLSLSDALARFSSKIDPVQEYLLAGMVEEKPIPAKRRRDDEILIAIAEGASPEDLIILCSN